MLRQYIFIKLCPIQINIQRSFNRYLIVSKKYVKVSICIQFPCVLKLKSKKLKIKILVKIKLF